MFKKEKECVCLRVGKRESVCMCVKFLLDFNASRFAKVKNCTSYAKEEELIAE